jgi:hypothetical protein
MNHYLAVFMGGLRLLFSGNREAGRTRADKGGQYAIRIVYNGP